jgi:hypothetical protein
MSPTQKLGKTLEANKAYQTYLSEFKKEGVAAATTAGPSAGSRVPNAEFKDNLKPAKPQPKPKSKGKAKAKVSAKPDAAGGVEPVAETAAGAKPLAILEFLELKYPGLTSSANEFKVCRSLANGLLEDGTMQEVATYFNLKCLFNDAHFKENHASFFLSANAVRGLLVDKGVPDFVPNALKLCGPTKDLIPWRFKTKDSASRLQAGFVHMPQTKSFKHVKHIPQAEKVDGMLGMHRSDEEYSTGVVHFFMDFENVVNFAIKGCDVVVDSVVTMLKDMAVVFLIDVSVNALLEPEGKKLSTYPKF